MQDEKLHTLVASQDVDGQIVFQAEQRAEEGLSDRQGLGSIRSFERDIVQCTDGVMLVEKMIEQHRKVG